MPRPKMVAPSELSATGSNLTAPNRTSGEVPEVPAALLGAYRVEETLGAGAMGVVYRATHLALGRSVAIKLPTISGAELIERFVREGRLLAGLQHANLVRVFDAGEVAGRPYLVLEYIRGCALSTLAYEGRLPVAAAVALVVQLLDGLGHAHSHGVLHRDVKSENALVTQDGVVKLADFGLARSEADSGLTRAGMIMGTPAYMSPEQARGEIFDARSDLYAAAVVLFELLAGRRPFQAENALDLLAMQIHDPPPSLMNVVRGIPAPLADAVNRGLAKAPEARFSTAEEFIEGLRAALGEQAVEQGTARLPALVAGVASGRHVVAGTTFLENEAKTRQHEPAVTSPRQSLALPTGNSTEGRTMRRSATRGAGPATLPSARSSRTDTAAVARRPSSGIRVIAALGAILLATTMARLWVASPPSVAEAVPTAERPNSSSGAITPPQSGLGAVQIESQPPGARVLGKGGSDTGQVTPALIERLAPVRWEFSLELPGYARGLVDTQVVAGQTRRVDLVLEQRLLPMKRNEFHCDEFRNPKDGSVLIFVPGGSFTMGANDGDGDEKPVHTVVLSPYYIGKTEVTWRQYLTFCAAEGRRAPAQPSWAHDDHPVVNVSWVDANAYCRWAGLQLPTESQWEFAARGKDGRKYPWGPEAPNAKGVYRANYSPSPSGADESEQTAPVGSFGPDARLPRADGSSPVGARDMAGNVWEWCSDWYDPGYYRSSPEKDPTGPRDPTAAVSILAPRRVLRGGSWNDGVENLRCSDRNWRGPTSVYDGKGFRAARSFP